MQRKNRTMMILGLALMLICILGKPMGVQAKGKVVNPWSFSEDFREFLSCFEWYANGNDVFDPAAGTESSVMGEMFTHMIQFDQYPGPSVEYASSGDPLGRFGSDYGIYDGTKTDWILKNILHFSDNSIAEIKAIGDQPERDYYYYDGNYYILEGYVGGGYICRPCYAEREDDTYFVIFACYSGVVEYYYTGLQYAVVSKVEQDGNAYWTCEYWSRYIPEEKVCREESLLESFAGDWICEDDGITDISLCVQTDGYLTFSVHFYSVAGFDGQADVMGSGKWAVFGGVDESNFYGCLHLKDGKLIMNVENLEESMDNPIFGGSFKEKKTLTFRRKSEYEEEYDPDWIEDDFSITPEELEQELQVIRACYYNPTDEDSRISFAKDANGWNYNREYYFHKGRLAFAFIYNGGEEHRLYFKDGHMIRYIDENMVTYDWGNDEIGAYSDWALYASLEASEYETK